MDIKDIVARLGGIARAAEAFGVRHPSVCGWIKRGQVPATRAAEVARRLGVEPHAIRPDVFPPHAGGPRADALMAGENR